MGILQDDTETTLHDDDRGEILTTLEDFARQEGRSLGTVHRWAKEGQIQIVERLGRRYVNPAVPFRPIPQRHHDQHAETALSVAHDTRVERFVSALDETTQLARRAKRHWSAAFRAAAFLLAAVLVVVVGGGVYSWQANQQLADLQGKQREHIASMQDRIDTPTAGVLELPRPAAPGDPNAGE